MVDRKWYAEPEICPVCKKTAIDPDITNEMMEAACTPYGYIKCPEHYFPNGRLRKSSKSK